MRYVYAFEEGSKEQKYLLGGKGANLAEMTNLGLPVPPGFTITTDACNAYMAAGDTIPDGLMDEVAAARATLEDKMGKRFGDAGRPAARVGALRRAVLDAGDDGHRPQPRSQRRVGRGSGAADRQRALRVRLVPPLRADVRQDRARRRRREVRGGARRSSHGAGVATDPELSADDLRGLVDRFKGIVLAETGIEFPQDPQEQLRYAIEAVFRSWNGERAASTAGWRRSPTTSAPRSTCRRWCSATRATTPVPASRSPATRRPARTVRTATSWRTRRARTSSPASASPSRSTRWRTTSPSRTRSCSR